MLWNLHERLAGGAGARRLAESLRARFPAALIDEFQDTDPLQFAIFDRIYARHRAWHAVPGRRPQAGDLQLPQRRPAHLPARAPAHPVASYTLADNQRSSEPLIAALNGLFGANADAFMQPGLAFHAVGFGDKQRKPLHDETAAPRAPLQVWLLPAATATLAKRDARRCCHRVLRGRDRAPRSRPGCAARSASATRRCAPATSRCWCAATRTAARMRRALAKVGVGSVELSRASVFDSSDAEELDAHARRRSSSRSASRCCAPRSRPRLLGSTPPRSSRLGDDEAACSACIERFVGYRETWLARGIGTMLRELMHAEGLAARLLARPDGERRLTNLLHLAECLHEASRRIRRPRRCCAGSTPSARAAARAATPRSCAWNRTATWCRS